MKFAAKKKAKKEAAEGNGAGRKSAFVGLKLYKVEQTDKMPKIRETSRRGETLAAIKNGMKYETFAENGGSLADLGILVKNGNVEARAE